VLDAGLDAVLSHRAAAAWWDLPGFDHRQADVSRPRLGRRFSSTLAQLHEPVVLDDRHVTVLDGIPVTTPSRTICDLAAIAWTPGEPRRPGKAVPADKVARTLDTAWSRRLLSGASLRAVAGQLAARGHPGTVLMRRLLDDRGPGYVPPASGLERRFEAILRDAGEPPMERQVDVGGCTWLARVDYIDRPCRVVVQIDSDRFHASVADQRHDERQTAALEAAGFTVIRVWESDVWLRAAEVVDRVRTARRAAARQAA
jgi:very-short-patch-repair endonuclease